MARTSIEYLTHTWNPIVMKCSRVSEGCRNCWHLRMCDRMAKNSTIPVWKQDIYAGSAEPQIDEKALEQPIRIKKHAIIGVQFMGDLFHESVHNEMIKDVFHVIRIESKHTFLVLTKRPQRMFDLSLEIDYQLPNLWLGVSVEDQDTAIERIPILLETPAVHRWVSVEPMIGPVDLTRIDCSAWETTTIIDALKGRMDDSDEVGIQSAISKLDWVVCGGESGSGGRPIDYDFIASHDAVRSLREQCSDSGIPFFFKQWGDVNGGGRVLDGRTCDEVPWGDNSGSISEICLG